MSSDVAIDLIKDVNTAFQKNCVKDRNISKLMEKLDAGEATYKDAYSFATSIGNARAKAFKSEISSNRLPDGRMYYNIGSRLLNNTLGEDYNLVAEYAQGVQEVLNAQRGISLKALKADKNKDRIKGFVDRLSSEEDYDKVAWILDEPVKVHALSVVDDTIQKNAEFQDKAGIGVKVIRIAEADCCKWCSLLDGEYTYPGVKGEIFQRHDNCRCIVEYDGRKLSAYESKNGAHSFREDNTKELINFEKNGNVKKRDDGDEKLRIPQIPSSTVTEKVRNGEYSLKLSQQNYDKHVPGTMDYDRYSNSRLNKGLNPPSALTISKEEAQEIILQKSGTGIIKPRRDGSATDVEQITCNKVIGYYYQKGEKVETTKAAIHHGKNGSHLVPIKGNHYD